MVSRALIIILDGLGVGALPDAHLYGDENTNTLGNMDRVMGGLNLPELEKMGLGNIIPLKGVKPQEKPTASYGKMAEKSVGKDTITGHWEMAGLILEESFPLYPKGFPREIIGPFEEAIGRKVLGNKVASGTEIIEELGEEHLKRGEPIVYTSADSVFQIAAHEEKVPPELLYKWCKKARELLQGKYAVGRVIARPFEGKPGSFKRTSGRKDYPLKPFTKTLLDLMKEKGQEVISVGKVNDIFGGSGITRSYPTKSNKEGMEKINQVLSLEFQGLVFANLVDFDMLYGHRNDFKGFCQALKEFDEFLPRLKERLRAGDILIITSDHGCDPTAPGTDHTREYVPLLVYGKGCRKGVNLGTRETFSDMAATLAELFRIEGIENGVSFAGKILGEDLYESL